MDKINGPGLSAMDITSTKARGAAGAPAGERATRQAGGAREGDAVQITASASRLKRIEARLASLPEVDSTRVEALRARIAAGTWQPDPAVTAANLLRIDGRP